MVQVNPHYLPVNSSNLPTTLSEIPKADDGDAPAPLLIHAIYTNDENIESIPGSCYTVIRKAQTKGRGSEVGVEHTRLG